MSSYHSVSSNRCLCSNNAKPLDKPIRERPFRSLSRLSSAPAWFALVFLATSTVLVRPACDENPSRSTGVVVTPFIGIPIGSVSSYYDVGYGNELVFQLDMNRGTRWSPRLDVSYLYVPLSTADSASLSLLRGSGALQYTVPQSNRFSTFAYGGFGYYLGKVSGDVSSWDSYWSTKAGTGLNYQFSNGASITAGIAYDGYLGVFDGVSVFAGVTKRIAGPGGGPIPLERVTPLRRDVSVPTSGMILISDVEVEPVFPILWKYYDTHPIGSATISNTGTYDLTDIEVRLVPADFIDSPKLSARITDLSPGETVDIDLYVLFNDRILSVSEGAKTVTDVVVEYKVGDSSGSDTETITMETFDRNSLQWDDDRKIAAFVTARDDEIQRFAKSLAGVISDHRSQAVSSRFQSAMALYGALQQQGISYVVDPSSAYQELSDDPLGIDFVQFPRQTLYVGAGDCDDLSAAYCALLESVGIETAFVTIPAHIFTAFRLDEAKDREWIEHHESNLISLDDGSYWVPVETTILNEGFLSAWEEGARQWRRYSSSTRASFFRTREAWREYQPVAFSVSDIDLEVPNFESTHTVFSKEMDGFLSITLSPQVDMLRSRLEDRPDDVRLMNRIGVLYAKYGLYENAEDWFVGALELEEFLPAEVNLANLQLASGDTIGAADRFESVLARVDNNTSALIGLIRCRQELDNNDGARELFDRLESLAPRVAFEIEHLVDEARAIDGERASQLVDTIDIIRWEESDQ